MQLQLFKNVLKGENDMLTDKRMRKLLLIDNMIIMALVSTVLALLLWGYTLDMIIALVVAIGLVTEDSMAISRADRKELEDRMQNIIFIPKRFRK